MSYYRILYRVASLLAGCLLFAACTKDPLEEVGVETESPFKDGYSLNLMLTLDHMGGTRAADTPDVLREFENFIDPGKCRVLFFDHEEKFLFESKSRWVKQLSPGSDGVRWMVSIPMYPYGNDVKENWEWEQIRQALQDDKFKIAILANRPTLEGYPDLESDPKYGENRGEVKNFQNAGPYWTREDTRGYVERTGGDPNRIKTVFDLHHTQYDPIYRDKGFPTESGATWEYNLNLPNFYEFVMGKTEKDQLSMSSTSSWVDFGEAMDDEGEYEKLTTSTGSSSNKRRYARRADVSYPIPMYGIQEFNKIENWVEGVPFNLSDLTEGTEHEQGHYAYKDIALLRSVVKLEFVFPRRFADGREIEIDILQLAYPNVYARSEPMNVWKPTDQLWTEGHDESSDCEWFTLKKYARLVESNNGNVLQQGSLGGIYQGKIDNPTTDQRTYNLYNLYAYRRRLSWFYGAWLEKNWPFTGVRQYNNGTGQPDAAYVRTIVNERRNLGDEPPQIFNPCIQRNNRIMCFHQGTNHKHVRYDDFNDPNYHHFVVYTGERNSIDPSYLYQIDGLGGFMPTICYWHIGIKHPGRTNTSDETKPNTAEYYAYSFPITDYARTDNRARTVNTNFQQPDNNSNGDNRYYTYKKGAELKNSNAMIKYADAMVSETDTDLLPWPLMRNHHYKIVIGSVTRAGEEGNDFGFSVRSEVNYSESLGSQRPIRTAEKKQQN